MADDRPDVYVEDSGLIVYRASSVGMCVRALVVSGRGQHDEAIGKDRSDMLERTADEGNLHEGAVRQKLVKEGWEVISTQEQVDIPVIKGIVIRGHTDGLMELAGDQHLLEVKSMSTKRFARWQKEGFEGFIKYAYQISSYMQAYPEHDVLYVVKRREDGLEDRQIISAGQAPISWKGIRKKILTAEAHRRKRTSFPACDVPPSEMYWCPFWYLHDEKIDEDATEMTDEMRQILIELVPRRMELSEIEQQGKDAAEARKSIDKEILNLMGSDRSQVIVDFDEDNDVQITRVTGGSTSLDTGKLKSDLGDKYSEYEKPYSFSYPKITIKQKKGKKGTAK